MICTAVYKTAKNRCIKNRGVSYRNRGVFKKTAVDRGFTQNFFPWVIGVISTILIMQFPYLIY